VAQAPVASGSITPEPKVEAKAVVQPETKAAEAKPEQSAKAMALLEGKPVATTPARRSRPAKNRCCNQRW